MWVFPTRFFLKTCDAFLHANKEAGPWCGWEHKSGISIPNPDATFAAHLSVSGSVQLLLQSVPQNLSISRHVREDFLSIATQSVYSTFHQYVLSASNVPGIVKQYLSYSQRKPWILHSLGCHAYNPLKITEGNDLCHLLYDQRFDEDRAMSFFFHHCVTGAESMPIIVETLKKPLLNEWMNRQLGTL